MSEHQEDPENPTGLGIDGLGESTVEPQQNDIAEHKEIDSAAAEDIDTVAEQQHLPRLELPEGQSDGDDSQPASAFSSSSEEDEDADDEADEQDEEAGEGERNEEDDTELLNKSPIAVPTRHQPTPAPETPAAVHGVLNQYREFTLLQNRQGDWVPYCSGEDSSSSEDIRVKDERVKRKSHRQSSPRRPSNLRLASTPDLPVLLEDQEPPQETGVLPEPSPDLPKVTKDASIADERESSQQPPAHRRKSSAASFVWSDEDEDDNSWVTSAIEDVKGSRGRSEDSATEHSAKNQGHGEENGSHENLEVPGNSSEAEEESFMTADEDASADADNKVKQLESPERPSNYSEQPEQDPDHEHAPARFRPVYEDPKGNVAESLFELKSPEFRDPEPLTGLSIEEGIDAWWEWKSRNRPRKVNFRTNRKSDNEDKEGDLGHWGEINPDTSDAADYLEKQRFMLKELAARKGEQSAAERASNIRQNMEDTTEYLKLKMLKYRAQRTFFYERVARRESTIVDLEARTLRRDQTIRDMGGHLKEVQRAYDENNARFRKLEPMLEEFSTELQREKDLREKEKSARKELQVKIANLNQYNELLQKSAEANAEEVRLERAKRGKALNSLSADGLQVVKYSGSSRSATPSPGRKQFVDWPLSERTQVVPYMVKWINNNKEDGSEPLSPSRLDEVLDKGSLAWEQLIDELKQLGHIFRPDHLAAALSDPKAISAGDIPRPNPAVMYAARRLSPETAVSDLLSEVAKLQEELEGIRMPQQLITQIDELETENRKLMALQNEGPQSNLDSIQSIVNQFVESTSVPMEDNDETTELRNKLAVSNQHGQTLQTKVDSLAEQIEQSEEACATLTATCAELEELIEELEEQLRLATKDDDESSRAEKDQLQDEIDVLRWELREQQELEAELSASKAQSEALQIRLDELEGSIWTNKEETGPNHTTSELQSLVGDLQSDLTAANEANDALTADFETLQADFEIQATEFETLQADFEALKTDHEAIEADAEAIQQHNDEVMDLYAEVEEAKAASDEQVEAARNEIEGLQELLDEMKTEFAEHKCLASSSSSSPSHSARSTSTSHAASHGPWMHNLRVDQGTQTELLTELTRSWEQRERNIAKQPRFANEQKRLQEIREQRQAAELERLAIFRRDMDEELERTGRPYRHLRPVRVVAAMA